MGFEKILDNESTQAKNGQISQQKFQEKTSTRRKPFGSSKNDIEKIMMIKLVVLEDIWTVKIDSKKFFYSLAENPFEEKMTGISTTKHQFDRTTPSLFKKI